MAKKGTVTPSSADGAAPTKPYTVLARRYRSRDFNFDGREHFCILGQGGEQEQAQCQ